MSVGSASKGDMGSIRFFLGKQDESTVYRKGLLFLSRPFFLFQNILGKKTIAPTVAAPMAVSKTAPAATSFTLPASG